MERERVSLARCEDYKPGNVRESVSRAFELLGGVESVVSPGDSVFVKTNSVIAAEPDSGVVTNPVVARAVIEELKKVTSRITVGDSPGGPFNQTLLKRVYEKTGVAEVARETGVELALDTRTVDVPFPDGRAVKRLTLCKAMVEADRLISVSKLKAHRFMNVTGPIKNLYGTVPGTTKFVYHSRFEEFTDFAQLVLDVHLASRPAFHVLDAVEVLEGGGSKHGTKRKMKFVAAGRNAFALEALMMELIGVGPDEARLLSVSTGRGLCPAGSDWFDVLGDDVEELRDPDYELPERNFFSERVPALIAGRFSRFFTEIPSPRPDICTGCGKCAEACPKKAITIRNGLPVVDPRKCIRCYCCDELCERQAMGAKRPALARILHPFSG